MFDKIDSYAKLKISHLPRQFNCDIIVRHTSITQDMLDDWYAHKKDVFFNAQQALEYKLIDKIL